MEALAKAAALATEYQNDVWTYARILALDRGSYTERRVADVVEADRKLRRGFGRKRPGKWRGAAAIALGSGIGGVGGSLALGTPAGVNRLGVLMIVVGLALLFYGLFITHSED